MVEEGGITCLGNRQIEYMFEGVNLLGQRPVLCSHMLFTVAFCVKRFLKIWGGWEIGGKVERVVYVQLTC